MTTSPLLHCDIEIYPKDLIKAHAPGESVVVTLSEDSGSIWPQNMITGGSDRKLSVWNLSCPQGPILVKDLHVNAVTDISWMSHYDEETFGIAMDDVYSSINKTTVYNLSKLESVCALQHSSCTLSMDYSPLNNVILTSSSAGEVLLFVGFPSKSIFEVLLQSRFS